VLDREQIKIFDMLITQFKDVLRDKRSDFIAYKTSNGIFHIEHPFATDQLLEMSSRDFFDLSDHGLINISFLENPNEGTFNIPLEAFVLFKELKIITADPIEIIGNKINSFIYTSNFQSRFNKAYNKWIEAEKLFSDLEVNQHLSTIGLLCREAMQEFLTHLVDTYKPTGVESNPAQVKSRFSSIIKVSPKFKSETVRNLLNASFNYWDQLNSYVQRQTHAGQKEGEKVTVLDAKRILLHTAFLFFEIDQLLKP